MSTNTTISNAGVGMYGFTFEATSPSGRKFLLSVLHTPSETANVANLVIGSLGASCYFASVSELTPGSEGNPSASWAFDETRQAIAYLDTL